MTPEQLFDQNIKLAYHLARKWANRLPFIDRDDIYQEALLGLWKASGAFDPSRDKKFGALAAVCIGNQVKMLLRKWMRRGNERPLEAPVCEDGEGNELTLEDVLSRPQALADLEAEIRRIAPLAARYLLDGYVQREIGKSLGISQSWTQRLITRELRRLRETLDTPMTQAPQRKKPSFQIGWDLRVEGESGPVVTRRVTEEEAAKYARQRSGRKIRSA